MANWRKSASKRGLVYQKVEEIFGADLRSLAALRIVLALVVLYDVATRATNLAVHYSDGGILPRRIQVDKLNQWDFSLNFLNGTAEFQAILFLATAVAALGMLVGYRTRLMIAVAWVLVMSIQWRNYQLGSGADDLLRLLLFWSIFLPLGAYWSLDRWRGAIPGPPSTRIVSVATIALFLQIAFMYWFTALLKSGAEWRVDGTAIYYALSAKQLGTPFGAYLLQFPELLKALTFGTLGVEVIAPLLLFSPFYTTTTRMLGITAIVGLHAGIAMTMAIGFFPWIAAGCMVCFLPSWFWDALVPDMQAALRDRLPAAWPLRDAFANLQRVGWSLLRVQPMLTGSLAHFSVADFPAESVAKPGRPGLMGMARAPIAPPATRGVIRVPLRAPLLTNLFCSACLAFVLVWNLAEVAPVTMPQAVQPFGIVLGLPQYWAMFAPYPTKSTMWFVLPGTLKDGTQIDLLPPTIHNDPHLFQAINWAEPSDVRATFNGDERWRKYLESLTLDENSDLLLYFGQYVCRVWNGTNGGTDSQLMTFDIVNLWEMTLESNQRGSVQQQALWSHTC